MACIEQRACLLYNDPLRRLTTHVTFKVLRSDSVCAEAHAAFKSHLANFHTMLLKGAASDKDRPLQLRAGHCTFGRVFQSPHEEQPEHERAMSYRRMATIGTDRSHSG